MTPPPPISTLFPYTTLFRSLKNYFLACQMNQLFISCNYDILATHYQFISPQRVLKLFPGKLDEAAIHFLLPLQPRNTSSIHNTPTSPKKTISSNLMKNPFLY